MPTYSQNITAGQLRHRIWHFNCENPNVLEVPGATPSMTFFEQEVVRLDDGTEHAMHQTRSITVPFDPAKVVPLRDPTTDALIPGQSTTHAAIMALLYSLARQAQEEQDAVEAAAAAAAAANGD